MCLSYSSRYCLAASSEIPVGIGAALEDTYLVVSRYHFRLFIFVLFVHKDVKSTTIIMT